MFTIKLYTKESVELLKRLIASEIHEQSDTRLKEIDDAILNVQEEE